LVHDLKDETNCSLNCLCPPQLFLSTCMRCRLFCFNFLLRCPLLDLILVASEILAGCKTGLEMALLFVSGLMFIIM